MLTVLRNESEQEGGDVGKISLYVELNEGNRISNIKEALKCHSTKVVVDRSCLHMTILGKEKKGQWTVVQSCGDHHY